MLLGRVVGNVVASLKEPRLTGMKLLLVRDAGTDEASPFVAVDLVGAGEGDIVLVVRGMPAAMAVGNGAPVDAAIVGIVDAGSSITGRTVQGVTSGG